MLEKMWNKGNTPPLLAGMQTCTATLKIMRVCFQKTGTQPTSKFINITLGINHKYTCSTMFISALFIIARTWKQPRCPTNEEWIKKIWYIYTTQYYSVVKNSNDILKFAGKWNDPEKLIPSEVTQIQKDKHSITHS